jgi:hypothetical protein
MVSAFLVTLGCAIAGIPAASAANAGPVVATIVDLSSTVASSRTVGGVTLQTLEGTVAYSGTINGEATETLDAIVRPDGSAVFTVRDTCQCTFAGRTGRVVIRSVGRLQADGSFTGTWVVIDASGQLTRLRGSGTFVGRLGEPVSFFGRLLLT